MALDSRWSNENSHRHCYDYGHDRNVAVYDVDSDDDDDWDGYDEGMTRRRVYQYISQAASTKVYKV